jgi:ligand-binding sensor domain-containing protein
MKHIYILLIALPVLVSTNNSYGQITQAELEALVTAGIDPYFVESRDTFSTRGPQCIVRDVLQDKNGNYWFATWHGIMGYDGNIFTNYTLKHNLIHFHVLSCYEDRKGNLWFGTARGGLYFYNGKSFRLFTTTDGLADNTVMSFAEDKTGNIWIGTERGASRYDGKGFTNFTTTNGLIDNFVNAVLSTKNGMLWFGTMNGVSRYDGKSFTPFTDKDGKPFQQVASLFEDKEGKIWIGSGKGKGLCYYDGNKVSEYLIPDFVMYMCEDKNGNLWLAHNTWSQNQGRNFILYRYDGKSFNKTIVQKTPSNNPAIFGITEDKNGKIWFGTAEGVCCYDGKEINNFRD